MLPLTVGEIVRATQGVLVIGDPAVSVGEPSRDSLKPWDAAKLMKPPWPPPGISTDSRTLKRGDIFFALRGDHYDGNQFLTDGLERGAFLCVASQIPHALSINLSNTAGIIRVKDTRKALADCARVYRRKYGNGVRVASVNGACGKTTVKEMIAQILASSAPTLWSPGNFNNDIGCPLSVLSLRPDYTYAVFEIGGSARGDVGSLAEIVMPEVAVITNILLEHTETFGSLEDIAKGESEVLSALGAGGTAVLPYEDSFYEFMKAKVPKNCKIVSFGFSDKARVHVRGLSAWPPPNRFTLVHQNDDGKILEELECTLPVMGRFNVLNACAAAAVCFSLGVSGEVIREGLRHFSPPGMRFQMSHLKSGAVLVNDSYNANPGSMRTALESFVECFPDRKRCVVLADMLELGEISRKEHAALGEFLAGLSLSEIVLFGAQSRSTAEGARKALVNEKILTYCADRESLLAKVRSLLSPEAAILFKGSRGMRLEEIIQKLDMI